MGTIKVQVTRQAISSTVWWADGEVRLLDQTRLPQELVIRSCARWEEVAEAIRTLQVRGAPAIGAAAAYGLALAAHRANGADPLSELQAVAEGLAAARPTAVNLRWAVERMVAAATRAPGTRPLAAVLLEEAERIAAEDVLANRCIAAHGAALISPGERIMTYCNTGALATVDIGTAYGIVREAHRQGRGIHLIICETRPILQGARLTTWEAARDGIPATLITDNAAASLMARGEVDRVIVGADRVARNGDVANKIGTYALAVLAHAHGIPFLVAAPTSTVDTRLADGGEIPIEERSPDEVTALAGRQIAAGGVAVRNPAFDVTPHRLITALVTETGVLTPPYEAALTAPADPAARG